MKVRVIGRALGGLLLAGFATVGFVHVTQPDPGYTGGLARTATVQRIHETGPNWSGGLQAADISYPQPDVVGG